MPYATACGGAGFNEPDLLRLDVRVGGLLPRLEHLKRHALLSEQDPEALMAEVVDHPLGDRELSRLFGIQRGVIVDSSDQFGLPA